MKISDRDPSGLMTAERDACAIICYVDKSGRATHGNVQRTIEALVKMGHRAGEINGEGDGCGILTDIPRKIWNEVLSGEGHPPGIAYEGGFAVGHFLIAKHLLGLHPELQATILKRCQDAGLEVLGQRPAPVRSEVLAAAARQSEPLVWQVALRCPDPKDAFRTLYRLQIELEQEFPIHVASLSGDVAAYKVHGAPEILPRYYPELKRRDFLSSATIGHSRYSTNTLPTVLRAQPFSLLGHNGEINTIARLREEARMLGIVLPVEGSDSQDLNRTLEGLMALFGLNLFEAMEMVFPPIYSEMDRMEPELNALYRWFRHFLSASAQGPAAIIARHGDRCVFSVDAMGLRPLWVGETDQEIFASSELGVVPHEEIVSDPKPLAPGEKVGLQLVPGERPRLFEHHGLRREVYETFRRRTGLTAHARSLQSFASRRGPRNPNPIKSWTKTNKLVRENLLSALAWKSTDVQNLKDMARNSEDPITSLGYDGPLAALSLSRQNLSDYFKEQVAVVTNPAIDREREAEHFSTRVMLGARCALKGAPDAALELPNPLLLGGGRFVSPGGAEIQAAELDSFTLEDVFTRFGKKSLALSCSIRQGESLQQALDRLVEETVIAVCNGIRLILLDDADVFTRGSDFLDPYLVVAVLHKALKETTQVEGESLRRRVSLVLRSGALRNLHDLIFALGMGADALCPYLMWEQAEEESNGVANLYGVLVRGLEKVISTMGTHEIGGYGKYFASIGLSRQLAESFETPNFCGSYERGVTLEALEEESRSRTAVARRRDKEPIPVQFRLYPRIWKMVGQVAKMEESYADLSKMIQQFEVEHPLAIRHLIDLRYHDELSVDPDDVDTSVGGHDLPILFSAMSFGSQGETPFRIYAEAARRLNIVCMNGEGGEIADMLGRYRKNRGQQIASGRFGVSMEFLNSADVLEIKVGQGAKPGEGGHLPGFKVTAKIAAARHATPGVSLISPSNNHDIYSIEDLAQIIEELRTANPTARISVKVPAVAGFATIALGIVKAGADIITISGYDGGTGAARKHAVKFVGLPAEIGVREAHRALVGAGMRQRVEIWADGGARTGRDVLKLMLLGANRVGFGTLPMVIIGCTACRGCHLGTCHVGIATQIETPEEAQERGLRRFVPRVLENGVIYETTFFRAMAREIRILTAKLGFRRTQDLVGRADLLVQNREQSRLDLEHLLAPVVNSTAAPAENEVRIIRKPLNYLTSLISGLVGKAFAEGEERVRYDDDSATSSDRAIGTHLAGTMVRGWAEGTFAGTCQALLHFHRDSIPGNGLGSFIMPQIAIRVEGGAQDGVGKSMGGGKIVILKGENRNGTRVGGSVGKGLAYGATAGTLIVQGDADSRACIRLSGADVVLGGRIRMPLDDSLGNVAGRANLKGFAFEYMTAGRAVVLGDPGPWLCSGMTGGTVYCHLDPEMGLDREALRRRLARGAGVEIRDLEEEDVTQVEELLGKYRRELLHSHQEEESDWLSEAMAHTRGRFVKIVPEQSLVMPKSTE
ncbi:glutamate synthase-related protein [Geomesophilobacter sediminis]|uniref:Alpha-hydroxy-acid oxidizing protein n=1 Tax=Geomesophilobacter sediminis TaxID=2798584 RepID=A0A8J7LTW6_9BACT|nr:glutamate synthase-related protein [Geomesophilobacter sediminis]MBJ6723884.1 alpha-hydroxy-acid oxidizing protein [Geomesophilobacter sediminis]